MKNLKIDESTGLVLEGGGMRGVFTCGVLDYFTQLYTLLYQRLCIMND